VAFLRQGLRVQKRLWRAPCFRIQILISVGDSTPSALIIATWIAAVASLLTVLVLFLTLRVALNNLNEFKSSERVKRTAELFFNFYTQEYLVENDDITAPAMKRTPFMAISSLIRAPGVVKHEIVVIVHNYLEAVAALHWKNLIDSELYFDSFAEIIVTVYEPLVQRLAKSTNPLTPYSRIPALYFDAKRYLEQRASETQPSKIRVRHGTTVSAG
jgi:hypothetical protein